MSASGPDSGSHDRERSDAARPGHGAPLGAPPAAPTDAQHGAQHGAQQDAPHDVQHGVPLDAQQEGPSCLALYAALLGERLPSDLLVRTWLASEDAGALLSDVLDALPQPGCLEALERIDAERHGPDGPVRAEWPPRVRVAGVVRYVAMVALALHEHGVWRSSRPARELDPVAAAMLPIVPESWKASLRALRAHAQVV
jgi:hypothetical protein